MPPLWQMKRTNDFLGERKRMAIARPARRDAPPFPGRRARCSPNGARPVFPAVLLRETAAGHQIERFIRRWRQVEVHSRTKFIT
ncbi:hypothetical protein [Tsuneonella sp. HG222]